MSTEPAPPPVLRVEDLHVRGLPSMAAIVDEIVVHLYPGEILGVVGESGSGKTTLGLALLKYCKAATEIADGSIEIDGVDLIDLTPRQVRRVRGRDVAYIPQSPASALNPALRIRTQIGEGLTGSAADTKERVKEVLREVALPDDDEFLARYPHELSGGQQQRVAIAMAFASRPSVIVLDEPTTGLDVTTQEHVLDTVREMARRHSTSAVYITHDMAVVSELADRIAVMYSGRIVEIGETRDVLGHPQHPYTGRLVLAVPDLHLRRKMIGIPGGAPSPLARPTGCSFAPRCPIADANCWVAPPPETSVGPRHSVRCYKAGELKIRDGAAPIALEIDTGAERPVLAVQNLKAAYGKNVVLRDVNLEVSAGECLALLGESGSGKTTLAQAVAGLHRNFTGDVIFEGDPLANVSFKRTKDQRHEIQYIFQNPYESLNPRRTVRDLILQPVKALINGKADYDQVLETALERAALRPDHAYRYPSQLSGGERQRVAIARALAVEPKMLICDEITSALDVSVQSSIVELLRQLQVEMGLTLLFITHNIALVRNIAQKVAVLEKGEVVEYGGVEEIFADPQHAYTKSLIADTPNLDV